MTDTGVVLSLFSALAVLAVGAILGVAMWAHARSSERERRELSLGTPGGEQTAGMSWLSSSEED